jgi:hypothetical protein
MLAPRGVHAQEAASAFSISETGKTISGKTLLSIEARQADAVDLLRAIAKRLNLELILEAPVRATVRGTLKGVTAEAAMERIAASADPPLTIVTKGTQLRMARRIQLNENAATLLERLNQAGITVPNLTSNSLQSLTDSRHPGLNRPVNLDVPFEKPILLTEALQQLQKQAGVAIHLHPGLPQDVKFAAQCRQTPLRSVLGWIAQTGSMRIGVEPGGSVWLLPVDRLQLIFPSAGTVASQPCFRCKSPVLLSWQYCPMCGQVQPRKAPNKSD